MVGRAGKNITNGPQKKDGQKTLRAQLSLKTIDNGDKYPTRYLLRGQHLDVC